MSDYIEEVWVSSRGEHPGRLIINETEDDNGHYDLGTWRDQGPAGPQYITVDAKFLHEFADYIKENIPETSPLEDASIIHTRSRRSHLIYYFFKIDGLWYNQIGEEYSEEHLLEDFTVEEIIR